MPLAYVAIGGLAFNTVMIAHLRAASTRAASAATSSASSTSGSALRRCSGCPRKRTPPSATARSVAGVQRCSAGRGDPRAVHGAAPLARAVGDHPHEGDEGARAHRFASVLCVTVEEDHDAIDRASDRRPRRERLAVHGRTHHGADASMLDGREDRALEEGWILASGAIAAARRGTRADGVGRAPGTTTHNLNCKSPLVEVGLRSTRTTTACWTRRSSRRRRTASRGSI